MILKEMDFKDFYIQVSDIFIKYFNVEQTKELMGYVEILSDANFRCYRANMLVIAERKDGMVDHKFIADLEWVARSVGEYRVSSKARINKTISGFFPAKENVISKTWANDDVVYSIGEMMDRLSIEYIKREDFSKNNRPKHMINASQDLSDRVEKYLIVKLNEIDEKRFYECVHEQRTYDLEKIIEDLII